MRNLAQMIVIALLGLGLGQLTACSSSPTKNDGSETTEQTDGESGVASDGSTAMGEMNEIEEMPSAGSLDDGDAVSAETGEIDAGVESFIRDAIKTAEDGDLESAADALVDLIESPKGGFLAAYNLGVIRERQGRYETAARRYFFSLQRNPDFSPALSNLIRLYLRSGRVDDADQLGQKFVNERPDNVGHRAVYLLVPLAKGAYEDVIRRSRDVLKKDERNVDAMYAMAQANFELDRNELARAVIERAVELAPERADLFNFYGMIQLKLENKPGAIANFQKAIELRSQYPEARNNLGVLYHEARDFDAAAREFLSAVKSYPDYKEAFLNLGNSYKGLKRYKDAELAFKRALKIDETYPAAHFNLGVLYLDSEVPGIDPVARLQKAVDEFNTYKRYQKDMPKGDPADKYIAEAKKAIDVERQKAEMMRQSQMGAEESAEDGTE